MEKTSEIICVAQRACNKNVVLICCCLFPLVFLKEEASGSDWTVAKESYRYEQFRGRLLLISVSSLQLSMNFLISRFVPYYRHTLQDYSNSDLNHFSPCAGLVR